MSMFMIYVIYAHVSIFAVLLKKNKSLHAAGENKSLTATGDSKSLVVEDEKSLATVGDNKSLMTFLGITQWESLFYWGIEETLMTSAGN